MLINVFLSIGIVIIRKMRVKTIVRLRFIPLNKWFLSHLIYKNILYKNVYSLIICSFISARIAT